MKKTYHLCLSAGNEVMFRDLEDYHRGFNCFASALYKTESTGLVESFMSTHTHQLVQTRCPEEFMYNFRQPYSMYFNRKYHRKGRLRSMNPLTGIYNHNLDAKGRLFIPAQLREELGEVFYVTVSHEKCLWAYPHETWQALQERVNALSMLEQGRMRALFAYAAKCEPDSQGRILLPQNLRDFAGLTKSVTVVGSNNHVELWDSDSWTPIMEQEMTPENIYAIMGELGL